MEHQQISVIASSSPEMLVCTPEIHDRTNDNSANVGGNQVEDLSLESIPSSMSNVDRSNMLAGLLHNYSPSTDGTGRRTRRASPNSAGPPQKVQAMQGVEGVNQFVSPVRYGGAITAMNTFIVNQGISW
jgi:hypothetical protein